MTTTEAMIRKAGDGLSLSEITSLNLSDQNITELDVSVMNEMVTMKSLDLSGNDIRVIPSGLRLPSLTILDVSYNELTSIRFVKHFPDLECLYVTGNTSLGLYDYLIATVRNPNLTEIDDHRADTLQRRVTQTRNKFEIQVKAKWEVLFAAKYATGIPDDQVAVVTREFIDSLTSDPLLKNADSKFEVFMLKRLAKEIVKAAKNMSIYNTTHSCPGTPHSARLSDLHSPPTTPSRQSGRTPVPNRRLMDTPTAKPATPSRGVPTTPTNDLTNRTTPKTEGRGQKRRREVTPESSKPNAKHYKTVSGRISSPKYDHGSTTPVKKSLRNLSPVGQQSTPSKSKSDRTQLPCVDDYDPAYFVRCHSGQDDPADSMTKVWRCAFEPKPSKPGEHTNMVATCGGKIVCLVDCKTGKVMRRFKDTDKKESFYTLAWTTIRVGEDKSNILAVAGDACDVKLIHPSQLVMYARLEGHRRYISCLTFHPSHPTILYSGGKDNRIIVWDIGVPDLKNYSTKFSKLVVLQTPGTDPLNLAVSVAQNCLLAGCENACFMWKLKEPKNMKNLNKSPDLELCLPIGDDDDVASDDSNSSNIVDGLVLLANDTVVTKCVGQSYLAMWNLKSCIPANIKSKRPHVVNVNPTALLNYQRTTVDYIYLSAAQGLVAVGDDQGSLHLYNVEKLIKAKAKSGDTLFKQSRVLEWPEVTLGKHADGMKDLLTDKAVVVNTVAVNHSKDYMVCGTDNNLVCIWRRSSDHV